MRMMFRMRVLGLVVLLAGAMGASAEVKMPAIFGDHMVLQGGKTIPVWGWAAPGEVVTVTLGKDKGKATADAAGKWKVELKAVKENTAPTTLVVKGTNEITYTDVLIGDVWVASGQSNMEFNLKNASTGADAIKAANYPLIRLYTVPKETAAHPQDDINVKRQDWEGKWLVCTPEVLAAHGFSAVAFFFGRDIQKFTGEPVGLIHTSWGGTPAEAWTSLEGLKTKPELAELAASHEALLAGYDAAVAAQPQKMAEWKTADDAWKANVKPGNDAAMKEWQAKADAAKAAGQPAPPRPQLVGEPRQPDPTGGPGHPSSLYNGMIQPLIPYAIKGAIWYQGESNAGRGVQYAVLFPAMITDWRAKWGEGDFPFLYVELPDYYWGWGAVREAQFKTLSLPNTGMVTTGDVGTINNIHPPYKEIVGERMALVGEHVAYGKKFVYTGPLYKSMTVEGGAIRISFTETGGGLMAAAPPITGKDLSTATADKLESF
jgi:sialate O-acetylesterase